MPFSNLPEKAFKIWEKVYNASRDAGDLKERAAKKAWGAVKRSYKKVGGKWVRKSKKTVESGDILEYLRSLKNVVKK